MSIYQDKVKRQIDQYRDITESRSGADIQELPEIFHYWSNKYILPRIGDVFGAGNVFEIYSNNFRRSLGKIHGCTELLSIGCGDCSFEVGIAQDLLQKGVTDFVFDCYDISPVLVKKSRERVENLGLGSHFHISEADINAWEPNKTYCGAMAHQALHHVVELERLLGGIKKCLHEDGVFVSSDMIGRNGHQRWPEALEIVNSIWAFMPDHLKHNRLLKRFEETYRNHDCSVEGFEGIRAQDILPIMVKLFHFERFLGYGNLPEVFIERSFGHNFDPEDRKEKAFVDFLELLNGLLIDLGYLKPTMMFAVMGQSRDESICYKHWTPEFCIRPVDSLKAETKKFPERFTSSLKKFLTMRRHSK